MSRNYTEFWAAICTHAHNDHASGLAVILRHPRITFHQGWMHDIRNHVDSDTLRRAASADSGVSEVVETTKELAAAFASRGINPSEPFAGQCIAGWPEMSVVGPSRIFYRSLIEEVTKLELPRLAPPMPVGSGAPIGLWATPPAPRPTVAGLRPILSPSYGTMAPLNWPATTAKQYAPFPPPLGALLNSSVKRNPKTQPFNETSTILGVREGQHKLLFTADAGSRALSNVPPDWSALDFCSVPHHGSDGNLSQLDIERLRPKFAVISAKGDSSHPSRAIVSGLVKVGAKVASTHRSGNLWYSVGNVPPRMSYAAADFMVGTGEPTPLTSLRHAFENLR